MTNEIKIHIGYVGKTRAGDRVEMVRHSNDDFTYLFYGSNGMAYYRYGECKSCPREDTNDIVGPWEETVVSEIDWNDGKWHGWNGGACPVHPNTEVMVMGNDGVIEYERLAKHWDWSHGYQPIVAFCVTKMWGEPKDFWVFVNGHGDLCVSETWRLDAKHVREVL